MTIRARVRVGLMSMVAVAIMGLAGCDHYNCSSGATFGSSTCSTTTTTTGGNPTAFAFAVDQGVPGQGGSIDGFTLDTTAATFAASTNYVAPLIPNNLGSIGIVVAQKKFLYAVFEDLQQIYGWSIDSTGNLTSLGSPTPITLTGVPSVSYNQYVVITNPTGTLLFVSDASAFQVLVYQIGSTGALTALTPFTTGGIKPQNMAMDGLGNYLYVSENDSLSDHASSGIAAYSVTSTGALSLIANYPNFPMWQVQGDPSGHYLIGISGKTASLFGSDDDSIHVFSIGSTGALTEVTNSPFSTTNAPFNIAVQPVAPSGALIYSFNNGANPVEGYQLNATTGALTPATVNTAAFPWGQFDQSGQYLLLDGNTSLSAFQVSSSGGLTEIGSVVPLATAGYWAVTDVP
ncbi:MAG: lactonase family protein [Candidatus Sulfotelmatobacter sp.]|jgi:6-phosphogluconolactonase (cycloisomerase 2 family)